jgi:hypothetical protein
LGSKVEGKRREDSEREKRREEREENSMRERERGFVDGLYEYELCCHSEYSVERERKRQGKGNLRP